MKRRYLVTGANGHLGSALCKQLRERGEYVRGLALPGDDTQFPESLGVEMVYGDVRNLGDLREFFSGEADETLVIHAAGVVDINAGHSRHMEEVNLNGTRNVLAMCREFGVKRLLYVSSVHAIPEAAKRGVIAETSEFSPERVVGAYAKTKAAATQMVLDSAGEGVPAIVAHPSGIIGPYPAGGNHLVQLVKDYLNGKLPACVRGGYDFVDVRDCAAGCIAALERGRIGECYILSNRYCEISEVLNILRELRGGRKVSILPMWMARAAAPLLTAIARSKGKKPLFTKYSLYTLKANGNFTHAKADRELGYRVRDIRETLADTALWLYAHGECGKKIVRRKKLAANRA